MTLHPPIIDVGSAILDGYVFSYELSGYDQQYYGSYWISRKYGLDLQLVSHINFGFYAHDVPMARRVLTMKLPAIAEFLNTNIDVAIGITTLPRTQYLKERHTRLHLATYQANEAFRDMKLLEKTYAQVHLARQFGLKNYAKLIADVEAVDVRTVHERIQRMKQYT